MAIAAPREGRRRSDDGTKRGRKRTDVAELATSDRRAAHRRPDAAGRPERITQRSTRRRRKFRICRIDSIPASRRLRQKNGSASPCRAESRRSLSAKRAPNQPRSSIPSDSRRDVAPRRQSRPPPAIVERPTARRAPWRGARRSRWVKFVNSIAKEQGEQAMRLTSTDFSDDGRIPSVCTCEGEDASPALQWTDAPPATRSFVLLCYDPDAPDGVWRHWAAYDIPHGWSRLARGAGRPTGREHPKHAINDFGGRDTPARVRRKATGRITTASACSRSRSTGSGSTPTRTAGTSSGRRASTSSPKRRSSDSTRGEAGGPVDAVADRVRRDQRSRLQPPRSASAATEAHAAVACGAASVAAAATFSHGISTSISSVE